MPRFPPPGGPGWTRTCPTLRWRHSLTVSPAGWSSIRSAGHPSSTMAPLTRLRKLGIARKRWIGRGATATRPSTACHQVRRTRAARRAARGLATKQITNPAGPRHARADGVPLRGYRHDTLSNRYHTLRSDHVAQARAASQAKHARAREVAARIVAAHGSTITIEDCQICTWARLWGKRIALFSPGMVVSALAAECAASGGRLYRAGTRATALSQHCLCGTRVPKTLAQRSHRLRRVRNARGSRHYFRHVGSLRRAH